MKLLVTGATGFIGRRLVSVLQAQGLDLLAVARMSDHGLPCPTFVTNDPLSMSAYETATRADRFDVVVNLLAAGVDPTERDEEQLIGANTTFPARLCRMAAQGGARAFIHIGSSAEYAVPEGDSPIRETAALETGRLYGATKAAGSILVQSVGRQAGLPTAVLRAFNVFGPGEKPYRLFPTLAAKLARREPADLSPGRQTRDFLYVDDACDAIVRMARALVSGAAAPGEYNLGSGRPVTVRAFAATIGEMLAADPTLLRFGAIPMRPDEVPHLVADTAKLDAAIGPATAHSLLESMALGIRELGLEPAP